MGCPECGSTRIVVRIDETRQAWCSACEARWTQTGNKQEDIRSREATSDAA